MRRINGTRMTHAQMERMGIRYLQFGGDWWNKCGDGWVNADAVFTRLPTGVVCEDWRTRRSRSKPVETHEGTGGHTCRQSCSAPPQIRPHAELLSCRYVMRQRAGAPFSCNPACTVQAHACLRQRTPSHSLTTPWTRSTPSTRFCHESCVRPREVGSAMGHPLGPAGVWLPRSRCGQTFVSASRHMFEHILPMARRLVSE